MILKNATLATLFITLLTTRPVESAGRKRKHESGEELRLDLSPLPETLQMGDSLTSPRENRKKMKHPSKTSTKQKTSLILMEDPIASSPGAQSFRETVKMSDMDAARNVFRAGSDELKKYCAKHLISLGSSRVVELINVISYGTKQWMLRVLLVHAGQPLIDKVFAALKPPSKILPSLAYSAELTCIPQIFTYILGKITGKHTHQEFAVKLGVRALFDRHKTECFDSLLNALQ